MSESAGKYMKTIYVLMQSGGCVHSVDVARRLGVTKASVSNAMANLRKSGLISMKEDGEIVFTKAGKKAAVDIYERQVLLSRFLKRIAGVDGATADLDAERIEHFLSNSTFEGIKRFIEKSPDPCPAVD